MSSNTKVEKPVTHTSETFQRTTMNTLKKTPNAFHKSYGANTICDGVWT